MIDSRSTRAYRLEKENRELKKEIKDLIELCNKYELEHNTAFKLWTMKMEEMPTYEEKIEMQNEIERLNNIINEATEEIKRVLDIWENKPNEIATLDLEYLLNILKGSDKE